MPPGCKRACCGDGQCEDVEERWIQIVVDTTLVNVCVRAVAVVSVRGRWRGNQVHLMCCRRRHQVVGTALVNVRAVMVVSMRGGGGVYLIHCWHRHRVVDTALVDMCACILW